MESVLSNLPAWALLVVAVVWLAFQTITRVMERSEAKDRAKAVVGDRVGTSHPSASGERPDVRLAIERDREQRESARLATETHELVRRIAEAQLHQQQVLTRVVEMLEREAALHEQLVQQTRALSEAVRVMMAEPGRPARLHRIE